MKRFINVRVKALAFIFLLQIPSGLAHGERLKKYCHGASFCYNGKSKINFIIERLERDGLGMDNKVIALPKLNRLEPSLESTALKLMEEAGELAQAIGKFRGLSGEKTVYADDEVMVMITQELLDVAQTAVSMMYVLEDNYQVDIGKCLAAHIQKLMDKGYLSK